MAVPASLQIPEPHIPVLLRPLLAEISPISGVWLDGTLGAGAYSRALIENGAQRVIAIDRDSVAVRSAVRWARSYGDRLRLVEGTFGSLDQYTDVQLDGIALDLGVSSMQLDDADRGFSFMADGPLDMRMSGEGSTATGLVNELPEAELAEILRLYGEERAAWRIARAIVKRRTRTPITRTLELSAVVQSCLPRARPGQSHPATRTFQALRIAVNDEFGQLVNGLEAAERALKPGGLLAVVTFHSIEDRVVKRFFRQRGGLDGQGSRHGPPHDGLEARFHLKVRGPIEPDTRELAENRRSRSAKLRIGIRTQAEPGPCDRLALGLPLLQMRRTGR